MSRFLALSCSACLLFFGVSATAAPALEFEPPAISGGGEAASQAPRFHDLWMLDGSPTGVMGTAAYVPGIGFDTYNFDDNATETGGFVFIPPDPMGAAGTDRLLAVVNVGIECRNKSGTLLWRDSLKDFFSPLGAATLGTFTFDPKVVYDPLENRFVVVTLERTDVVDGDPADASRILVAVSKTSSPATATAADWHYLSIDSKITVGATQLWADYPGLEVDEEVIYITMSYFNFKSYAFAFDQRLWIVDKGVAAGFYAGGAATVNVYDAYTLAGFGGFKTTTMPCMVEAAGGVGAGIGTFLLSYSGLTFGGPAQPEALVVLRVDTPAAGAATFLGEFVTIGDIEDVGGIFGFPNIPGAPQSGSVELIDTNDRRALDAEWQSGFIYLTTTINPNVGYDPLNTGQATAHVIKLNATSVTSSASPTGLITLSAETNIGAEDVASGTYTFFPAVAVNNLGDVKVGFAGSASSIFGSAFVTEIVQATFTPTATTTVRAGVDYYVRKFAASGGTRNRWGDYTGISVDPSDGTTFWVFNEYAETRGTVIGGEDGRWGTAWLSCVQQPQEDFGDAPPPYFTLLALNGARHIVVPGINLGNLIDAEPDGLPHPNALGDDINNLADEDGLIGSSVMVAGQPAFFQITATAQGWMDVWIDFNVNGNWGDPGELVFSGPAIAGINNINWVNPIGAAVGPTYTRIRYNTGGALPPFGPAPDGEVEDYEIFMNVPEEDFGDAPDPTYRTLLASNGARHTIVPGVFLGNQVDGEPDGQPEPSALGDDLFNGNDDEDGVIQITPFVPGQPAQIDVFPSVNGWVDVFIDHNLNGNFGDAADRVFSGPVAAPFTPLLFNLPAVSLPGITFMRVRYNSAGIVLPPDGPAPDGEVEDYLVEIEPIGEDFGDARDLPYPTLLANNGARHFIVPGVFMGNQVDPDPDGQPTALADGDDLLDGNDDEDGVTFGGPFLLGQSSIILVSVSQPGYLDVWIDLDQNGSWFDPPDLVFSGPVAAGPNPIPVFMPLTALPGGTAARFRYNLNGPLLPDGPAPDGEVEDYLVEIEPPDRDFGDAPDAPYPTLLASNGAWHVIDPTVFMGNAIDAEADGQPTASANGDDASFDDEDGVIFASSLVLADTTTVKVTVSSNGWLDAWFDHNQNGVWDDPAERLISQNVSAGLNNILITTPGAAQSGPTYVRFRYNSGGAPLPVDGPAADGEVEDYVVEVLEQSAVGDPSSFGFRLAPATPNPFSGRADIRFELPEEGAAALQVFTMNGRLAATLVRDRLPAGPHQVQWNGSDDQGNRMPSGIYLYRLVAGGRSETQKIILLR